MTVAADDVLRCTVEMNYESEGAVQNVYYLKNAGGSISDAAGIADVVEVLEALMNVLELLIAVLQVVEGIRIINATQGVDVGFGTLVDPTPFAGVGQVLPNQVAFGGTLHTARLGTVGRKFWGIPIVGLCSGSGIINAGSLTIMGNAMEDMTETYVATNSSWRYGLIATIDGVFLPFESYSLTTTAITQRRRRSGVGI